MKDKCTFTLKVDQETLDNRKETPHTFYTCDIPSVWVCSNCGTKFPPLVKFVNNTHCPECGAEVERYVKHE